MTVLLNADAEFARKLADDLRYGTTRGTASSLSVNATTGGGSITFTARNPGPDGDNISVVWAATGASVAASASGTVITIDVDNVTNANNTLQAIAEAVNGDANASALVYAEPSTYSASSQIEFGSLPSTDNLANGAAGGDGAGLLQNFLLAQDVVRFLDSLTETYSDAVATVGQTTAEYTDFICDGIVNAGAAQDLIGSELTWLTGNNAGDSHIIVYANATTEQIRVVPAVADTVQVADTFEVKVGNFVKLFADLEDAAGNPFAERRLIVDALTLAMEQAGLTPPSASMFSSTVATPAEVVDSGNFTTITMSDSVEKIDQLAGFGCVFPDVSATTIHRVVSNNGNKITVTPTVSGLVATNTVQVNKYFLTELTEVLGQAQAGTPGVDGPVLGDVISRLLDNGKVVTATPFG